jgi:hypothetical protein
MFQTTNQSSLLGIKDCLDQWIGRSYREHSENVKINGGDHRVSHQTEIDFEGN